jgi:hypothetical protein
MKQFFLGMMACGLLAVLPAQAASIAGVNPVDTSATSVSQTDPDSDQATGSSPSLCVDSMETVPDDDDLVPTPASMDGGCSVPETPISA